MTDLEPGQRAARRLALFCSPLPPHHWFVREQGDKLVDGPFVTRAEAEQRIALLRVAGVPE